MDKPSANLPERYAQPSPQSATHGPLLELLLSDVASDIEVVTRELGLRDEMFERLRRALDRLDCARAILEAEGRSRLGNSGGALREQTSEAERVLAENWTQDYAEGAVEWLLVGSAGCINQGCSEPPG